MASSAPRNEELTGLGLREAAALVRAGEVSPLELLDSTLERIAALGAGLNAFIRVDEDGARAAARAAERAPSGEERGPLHGVPIALKDNVAVGGEACSAGSRILAGFVPERDATVAARLRAAGAVFVGRTNMHEFAYGVTTDNPHYGAARNPWDPERTPGGSSGGSGAAVAARLCQGAIGTDTGCSVRLPAAFNGIAGLRPSIGRVSNAGIVPLAWTLDTAGPMCRTVEDCALMLGAIAGPDRRDPQTVDVPAPDYLEGLEDGLEGIRIGVVEGFGLEGLQAGVRDAVEAALGVLSGGGAELREVRLGDLGPSVSALLTVDIAEPAAYHAAWLRERPEEYGEDVRTLLEAGELYLASHYIQAQRYRSVLRASFEEALRECDAILTPTVPFAAPPVGATEVRLESGEELDIITAVMRYNALPPLTGMPALSVPCGFDEDRLPVGIQLIGSAFDEATLLRIGHGYQQLTEWHRKEPSL